MYFVRRENKRAQEMLITMGYKLTPSVINYNLELDDGTICVTIEGFSVDFDGTKYEFRQLLKELNLTLYL
jgi:hypothetical protein